MNSAPYELIEGNQCARGRPGQQVHPILEDFRSHRESAALVEEVGGETGAQRRELERGRDM